MRKYFNLKNIVSVLIITVICMMSSFVKASNETKNTVEILLNSKARLNVGETLSVSLDLSKIDAGNGIDAITASLEYDANVFETVKSSDVKADNDWTTSFLSSKNTLSAIKNTKVVAPESVLTIKFKVKNTVDVSSTKITLKKIVSSGGRVVDGGTGDIKSGNAVIEISKDKDPVSTIEPIETEKKETASNQSNDKVDKKASNNKGINKVFLVIFIMVLVVVIMTFLSKKKKNNRKK